MSKYVERPLLYRRWKSYYMWNVLVARWTLQMQNKSLDREYLNVQKDIEDGQQTRECVIVEEFGRISRRQID